MAPKLIDIAKEANVSPSAVSLTLNNKPGISTEVRKKIMIAATRMGYKNIPENQSWSFNKSISIRFLKIAKHGHIVNERHNAFITEYMEGIEAGVKKRKFTFEVSFFNRVPIEEIIAAQKDANIDGFIVLGTELASHELAYFAELPKPIVFIDTYFPLSVYDCIDIDNVDGSFKAVQHFYASGHRNIGLVKSNYETRNFKMRESGFREAMEYFSLPIQENCIFSVDPIFDQSIIDMKKHLNSHKNLPTALFCMNDIIAYGCMKALKDCGYSIPGDISIIGFDDLPANNLWDPPLTTVRVSNYQIGYRALEKLAERIIYPGENMPENILIAGNLVSRSSVKKI
jgi:LacI family transcriptional regulator